MEEAKIDQNGIDWNNKVDHIYCIHFLPKHEERFQRIFSELERVGILDSGIFSWKFTIDNPYYANIKNSSRIINGNVNNQSVFNCGFAHYEIYKEAQLLNYNRIMILEEDVSFLKDVNLLKNIVDDIPQTDVVLLDKFVYDPRKYISLVNDKKYRASSYFQRFDHDKQHFGSTASYILSRKAIDAFIKQQERGWLCADELWNDWNENIECNALTKSFSIINACYQKPFNGSIHDNIELAYKFVGLKKELYN